MMPDILQQADPELAALARARNYDSTIDAKYGVWLRWSNRSSRVGYYPWNSLFKPYQLFDAKPGEEPSVSLYSLTDYLEQGLAHQQAVYVKTIQALGKPDTFVPLEKVPMLATMRDAVTKQMNKVDRQLQSLIPKVQVVLQVWVAEAEWVLLQEGRATEVVDEVIAKENRRYLHNLNAMERRGVEREKAERLARRDRDATIKSAKEWRSAAFFYRDTRFLWNFMTKGIKQEALERLIGKYKKTYFVPEPVARSTRNGLLRYHSEIHPLHRKLIYLDNKRIIYEEILNAILLDEDIPDWKDIVALRDEGKPYPNPTEIRFSRHFRSDSKWNPYGQFIVNWYHELRATPDQTNSEIAKIIGERLNKKFEFDTSTFTQKQLQRVLDAHSEGRLTEN